MTTKEAMKDKKQFSTKRFAAVGAVNIDASPRFYPEDIRLAFEEGHPEYECHNPARYQMDYLGDDGTRVNQRDFDSIEKNGLYQMPLVAVITKEDGTKIAIAVEGSRRLYLARKINEKRVAAGGDAIDYHVDFSDTMSLAEIDEAHAAANEGKVSDDWMTRARKMRLLHRGRPEATPPVPGKSFDEIGAIFGVSGDTVEKILDKRRGLFNLSPKCQAALAMKRLVQANAFHLANLENHETQDAMLDRVLAGVKEGDTPDRNVTRAAARAAREAEKEGIKGEAAVEKAMDTGKTSKGGAARPPQDFRPTVKQLATMKANLKKLKPGEDLSAADIALCVIDYLCLPSADCIDRLPVKVQEALSSVIGGK